MLLGLGIRDLVLIDRIDLEFQPGLTVLTGETGAGKSILLDALGLALGARADSSLVRAGAAQAVITAEFDLPTGHPVWPLLEEQGFERADTLILRRTLAADGRSRASVNDQAASVGLLKSVGSLLVEIQGQFEQHGLLDPATHRDVLDGFAGASPVTEAWRTWRDAVRARQEAERDLERARAEEEDLRAAVSELDRLAPQAGEEAALATRRALLQNREKLATALSGAQTELSGDRGAARAIAQASRHLARLDAELEQTLAPIRAALDRAADEVAEAESQLDRLALGDDEEGGRIEAVEERLYDLRDAARKHRIETDALSALHETLRQRLAALDAGDGGLAALAATEATARAAYSAAAERLSALRIRSAKKLDAAIMAELPPLKLEKARFATRIERATEDDWGPGGIDRVTFEIATNPGAAPGPLGKIASGGELSRIMLALKVVLAATSPVPTLVFDEVDSGIGGAVAAAVGERLARLGDRLQVLVVTHSPQVAALGSQHLRVAKFVKAGATTTRVEPLERPDRREEIARMLSGADITEEARAAADSLMRKSA